MATKVMTAKLEESRSKTNNFTLNIEEQVQRKVQHASKALMKVKKTLRR